MPKKYESIDRIVKRSFTAYSLNLFFLVYIHELDLLTNVFYDLKN